MREVLPPASQHGLSEHTWGLVMITDQRSTKMRDFEHQPIAELAWLMSRTSEQFRLLGQVTVVGAESAMVPGRAHETATQNTQHSEHNAALQQIRQRVWTRMKPGAQAQMLWPHPGKPASPATERSSSDSGSDENRLHSLKVGAAAHDMPDDIGPRCAGDQTTSSTTQSGTQGLAAIEAPPVNFVLLLLHPAVIDHLDLKTNRRSVYYLPSAEALAQHSVLEGGGGSHGTPLTPAGVQSMLQACLDESEYIHVEVNA